MQGRVSSLRVFSSSSGRRLSSIAFLSLVGAVSLSLFCLGFFFTSFCFKRPKKKKSYDTQISRDTLKTRDTIMCIVDTPRNPIQSTIHIVLASRRYVSYDTYRVSYDTDYHVCMHKNRACTHITCA